MARTITPSLTEQIVTTSKQEVERELEPYSGILIPTGSTLLNLALSDRMEGGYDGGKIVNIIGDSSSGKSFLALSCLAEMAYNDQFKKYKLIYDDAEQASEFNIEYLFGKKLVDRMEAPQYDGREPIHSNTMQDFEANIHTHLAKKDPFIYILDSFDSITDEDEIKKVKENIAIRKKVQAGESKKKEKGSYGMAKAKGASQLLRMIKKDIKDSGSVLIIISQTRDNIDPMSMAEKRRSGGTALKFYCTHEMWLAHVGFIKKAIHGIDRKIGIETKVKISKNKLTGKYNEIFLPIYYDYGVDDIQSCIDFMLEEKLWKIKDGEIYCRELGLRGTIPQLIKQIEEKGAENLLRQAVRDAWLDIQDAMKLNRKKKYE